MANKLRPYIFQRAAEAIDNWDRAHCCTALEHICCHQRQNAKHYKRFLEMFMPTQKEWETIGFGNAYGTASGYFAKCGAWWGRYDREPRILALLLCAEILKNSGA